MPAISSEGQDSRGEQTSSRRSAVLDDPRRVAVDRRRQSLARFEAGPQQLFDTACLLATLPCRTPGLLSATVPTSVLVYGLSRQFS
jgi:hypothetical protein